jgi:hypothetical protein
MLGCSMYLQIHTVCTYALLKYNTQLILYTYLQCSIYIASPLPIYSLHSLHPTHTTCVYTPCKLPGVPMYSPCTPDINHWQLQKHCPCRTVVVGNPPSRPHGAGNHLAGRGCVMIPAHIRIYIYIYYIDTHTHIYHYLSIQMQTSANQYMTMWIDIEHTIVYMLSVNIELTSHIYNCHLNFCLPTVWYTFSIFFGYGT